MEEVIDLASDDKFSEFSKKVKQSLEDKLRNNPTMKDNGDKLNKFTDMANKFKEIATKDEPAVKVEEPKVEEPATEPAKEPEAPAEPEPASDSEE